MLEIILVLLALMVGKFFYDWSKQNKKIAQKGGMRKKYSKLVNLLMSGDHRTEILDEDPSSITIGLLTAGGKTLFVIAETFGSVVVQWKVDSPVFGKHSREWTFDSSKDQEEMCRRIMIDLQQYQFGPMGSRQEFIGEGIKRAERRNQASRIESVKLDTVREKLDLDESTRPDILRAARGLVTGDLDAAEAALYGLTAAELTLSELRLRNELIRKAQQNGTIIPRK